MAQSLGDLFTKELIDKLTDIPIVLRGIVLIEIPEFLSAKGDKFAILIALSNCKGYIGMVSINTNKPFSGNYLTLLQSEYNFLKYNSHVGCDVIVERPVDDVRKFLMNNPKAIKGEITNFQHLQILEKLTKSKGITGKIKNKYNLL